MKKMAERPFCYLNKTKYSKTIGNPPGQDSAMNWLLISSSLSSVSNSAIFEIHALQHCGPVARRRPHFHCARILNMARSSLRESRLDDETVCADAAGGINSQPVLDVVVSGARESHWMMRAMGRIMHSLFSLKSGVLSTKKI